MTLILTATLQAVLVSKQLVLHAKNFQTREEVPVELEDVIASITPLTLLPIVAGQALLLILYLGLHVWSLFACDIFHHDRQVAKYVVIDT